MTLAQIYAIIALLYAFNVPAPTVDTVQTILLNSQNTAQVSPISTDEGIGAPDVTRVTSCVGTPTSNSWPVSVQKVGKVDYVASIEQVWIYTPCGGQTWYLDANDTTIPMDFNGRPDGGAYKGLYSYVAKRVILMATSTLGTYSFTVKAHSPDTDQVATTSVSFTI